MAVESSEGPIVFNRKKRSRPNAIRQKLADVHPDETSNETSEVVTMAPKKAFASHLVQGSGSLFRKRARDTFQGENAGLALSDSEDDEKHKKIDSFTVNYSATIQRPRRRSSSPPAEISAADIIAQAQNKLKVDKSVSEPVKDDGIYRGKAGEKHALPKAFGPVKGGPSNVRTITVMDYQPNICKDYKETGFCGFGDSCIYLHDRGDYLQGWELDNQFLSSNAAAGSFMAKQLARNKGEEDSSNDVDSDKEDLPFACLICRKNFGKDPVITLCGHYFDSACAVKRFGKTGKCFACGAPTNGVFNKATKIIEAQKERDKLQAAAAAAAAEDRDEFEADGNYGVEVRGEFEGGATSAPETIHDDESEGNLEEEFEADSPPAKRRPTIIIEEARERRS